MNLRGEEMGEGVSGVSGVSGANTRGWRKGLIHIVHDEVSGNMGMSSAAPEAKRENVMSNISKGSLRVAIRCAEFRDQFNNRLRNLIIDERGDVPGWVLVVLMTTGLVTGIWTVAAPRIESLLRGSLDSMNNVR